MQGILFYFADDHGYHAVVAELVREFAVQGNIGGVFRHMLDIRLGKALCGQIELVAFIGKLGNPRHVKGNKHPDFRFHIQGF